MVETRIYTAITLDAIWYSQFTPYAEKPAEILSCQTKKICYISISCIIQRTRPSNISTYLCMRHNLLISNWYLVNKNSIWLNYSFEKETLARVWRTKIAFIFFPDMALELQYHLSSSSPQPLYHLLDIFWPNVAPLANNLYKNSLIITSSKCEIYPTCIPSVKNI